MRYGLAQRLTWQSAADTVRPMARRTPHSLSELRSRAAEYLDEFTDPSEHYAFWHNELSNTELNWGAFGENFTTEGALDDKAVHIGDRFRIGSAEFVVTQPRMPCFKLGIRFGRADMVKRFLHSRRNGFYFSVAEEGEVATGDSIEVLARDENGVAVADIVDLYTADAAKQDLLQRVSELPTLPENWRAYFRKRLWKPDA